MTEEMTEAQASQIFDTVSSEIGDHISTVNTFIGSGDTVINIELHFADEIEVTPELIKGQ